MSPKFLLEGVFYWLKVPLRRATKDNLIPANWEDNRNLGEGGKAPMGDGALS